MKSIQAEILFCLLLYLKKKSIHCLFKNRGESSLLVAECCYREKLHMQENGFHLTTLKKYIFLYCICRTNKLINAITPLFWQQLSLPVRILSYN